MKLNEPSSPRADMKAVDRRKEIQRNGKECVVIHDRLIIITQIVLIPRGKRKDSQEQYEASAGDIQDYGWPRDGFRNLSENIQ